MPFTVSHAVMALPVRLLPRMRGAAVPAGAVAAGAMAPDLPLFLPRTVTYATTHGFPGLLLVTVPIGLVAYAVWRLVIKPSASAMLPTAVGHRLPPEWDHVSPRDVDLRSLVLASLLLVLAVTAGASSHVLWDQFTHAGRWGEQIVPALREQWGPLPATKWLQYASGVGGLAVIVGWAVRRCRRRPVVARKDSMAVRLVTSAWPWLAAAAVGAVVVRTVIRLGVPTTSAEVYPVVFAVVTRGGAAVLMLLLVTAIVVRLDRTLLSRSAVSAT